MMATMPCPFSMCKVTPPIILTGIQEMSLTCFHVWQSVMSWKNKWATVPDQTVGKAPSKSKRRCSLFNMTLDSTNCLCTFWLLLTCELLGDLTNNQPATHSHTMNKKDVNRENDKNGLMLIQNNCPNDIVMDQMTITHAPPQTHTCCSLSTQVMAAHPLHHVGGWKKHTAIISLSSGHLSIQSCVWMWSSTFASFDEQWISFFFFLWQAFMWQLWLHGCIAILASVQQSWASHKRKPDFVLTLGYKHRHFHKNTPVCFLFHLLTFNACQACWNEAFLFHWMFKLSQCLFVFLKLCSFQMLAFHHEWPSCFLPLPWHCLQLQWHFSMQ